MSHLLPLNEPLTGQGRTSNKGPSGRMRKTVIGSAAAVVAFMASYSWISSIKAPQPPSFTLHSASGVGMPTFSQHLTHRVGDQDAHLLINEPTLCDDKVQQYSGYFTVDAKLDKKYFFWFFESRKSPSQSPTTMWLSGGPGASSMLALLMENGPCNVNADGSGTVYNPYSWTEASNMLWVDQPPGTGFSTGTFDVTEDQIAQDMYVFLQAFFHHFPAYNKNFHVTGESYGGHYVPAVAAKIVEENAHVTKGARPGSVRIDFKGMAIGNGMTVPSKQLDWYPKMAYNSTTAPSVVNVETYSKMLSSLPSIDRDIDLCNAEPPLPVGMWGINNLPSSCLRVWAAYSIGLMMPITDAGVNQYDLRLKGTYNFSNVDNYLNNPDVSMALGALKKWMPVNIGVWMHLAPTDFLRSSAPQVQTVLASGAKVLVYAGDQGFICNWLGNQAWTESLEWSHKSEFNRAKTVDFGKAEGNGASLSVGRVKNVANFAFMRVYGAGHMVPMDRPEESLYMLEQFLSGTLFN